MSVCLYTCIWTYVFFSCAYIQTTHTKCTHKYTCTDNMTHLIYACILLSNWHMYHVSVFLYTRACGYTFFSYVCRSMYALSYVQTYRCTDTKTHRHTDVQNHRHIHIQTFRCTDAQTHRLADIPIFIHVCMCVCMYICMHVPDHIMFMRWHIIST